MPVFTNRHPLDPSACELLAKVLRDDPGSADTLSSAIADASGELHVGTFNGSPVAMLLLDGDKAIKALVVHPATRGRGVGAEVLRQVAAACGPLTIPAALASLAAKAGLAD